MRSNGTACIFCKRLSSHPSSANRRTFNSNSSDFRKSPQRNGARNPWRRKHTSQRPNLRRIDRELGEEPGSSRNPVDHTLQGVGDLTDGRIPGGKTTLGVTPLDLIQLALLPHKAKARARVFARENPEIKELLDLFGASNDVFSQVLIGFARKREQGFTFGDSAFQQTARENGIEAEIPASQQSHATQALTRDEIIRRLQLAHTIDDILTVARAASQTACGRLEFMSLHFPLRIALKRCVLQRGPAHKELLAAFNSISSVLLEYGSDLDSRYCVIGLRYAAWTGSLPAMEAMKRYLNACRNPHLQMPDDTWVGIVNRIVKFAGSIERPKLPVIWGGSSACRTFEGWKNSRAWKRREALNLLTGWATAGVGGPSDIRHVSLESFLDRENTPVFAKYILSLGQLGASEAIWQEWQISRDRVLGVPKGTGTQRNEMVDIEVGTANTGKNVDPEPVNPRAVPNDAGSPEQLLFHFLQALMAAKDIWRSWQLIDEVRKHNPALLSSRIWASLLGFCHPYYYPAGHIFRPHRNASVLTEIVLSSLRGGGSTAAILELARTAMQYWEKWNARGMSGWRRIWALWADCAIGVMKKEEAEYVSDVERLLGVYWVATPDGGGVHVRKSDDGVGTRKPPVTSPRDFTLRECDRYARVDC